MVTTLLKRNDVRNHRIVIVGAVLAFILAASVNAGTLRRGSLPTPTPPITAIHTGYKRTATVEFRNAEGLLVPPPVGYEIQGGDISLDGGNVSVSYEATQVIVYCNSAVEKGDFIPGRPMAFQIFVALPGVDMPVTIANQIYLNDPGTDISSVDIVWGTETPQQ